MLKKRHKSRENSPSPKKQSDVSEEDYQQISELMPTEESQKALYNLLTKRKNLQEVSGPRQLRVIGHPEERIGAEKSS